MLMEQRSEGDVNFGIRRDDGVFFITFLYA